MSKLKIRNAMWPGLVGKGGEGEEAPLGLETMLDMTANARYGNEKFDGADYFLYRPHTDPDATEDELRRIADMIQGKDLDVGTLVANIWPNTDGGSAMGSAEDQKKFVAAVKNGCRIAKVFNDHGVRKSGVIRIDSAEHGISEWRKDPVGNTKKIAETFREAVKVAEGAGERLAAEGEICWAGLHSWKDTINLLEEVNMPEVLGFQADLAHTYLFMLGYNAPEYALVKEGYAEEEFWEGYETMTDALRPWTIDFHVAQNDATTKGSGTHDKTGRHCRPKDPNGKLDIVRASKYWLKDGKARGIKHICWDGCMFPNRELLTLQTWDEILETSVAVRDANGDNF